MYNIFIKNNYLSEIQFFSFIERDARYKKWKMAVERSLGWATVRKSDQMTGKCKTFLQAREMSDIIKAVVSTNNYINKYNL